MLTRSLYVLLFTCLLSSSTRALVTPRHASRDLANHAGLAARIASQPKVLPLEARSSQGAKRLRKRCKPKLPAAATSDAPVNPEAAPPSSSAPKLAPTTVAKPTSTTHKTTTTPKPTPTPSPTPQPQPAPPPPPPGNAILDGPHTGDGTYYETGLDACGDVDTDTDFIAAIGHDAFDNYPGANGNSNDNPICGKTVTATYQGKSVTVRIKDRCAGCDEFSLDFSPSAFQQLAPLGVGRITGMVWNWD